MIWLQFTVFLYVFVQDVLNWLVRCQKWIRIQEVSFEETKGTDGKLEIQIVYFVRLLAAVDSGEYVEEKPSSRTSRLLTHSTSLL